MKEGMKEVKISDLFKPGVNKVLVEVLFEGDTYGDTGIFKLDSHAESEPYVRIASVNPDTHNKVLKEGEYGLTRKEMGFNTMELYGKYYAVIDEYDIHAVISQEIVDQIKAQITKNTAKQKIQIVN